MRELSISMSNCGLRVLHRRDQSILYSCSNLFINQPRLINPIWLSNTSDQRRVTAKNLNIVFHCVILHQHNYYASSSSQKGSGVRKNKPPHQRRMSDSHGGKKALDWFSLLVQSQGSNIRNQLLPCFAWRKFTVETQPFLVEKFEIDRSCASSCNVQGLSKVLTGVTYSIMKQLTSGKKTIELCTCFYFTFFRN